jgi:hypothetical protein
MRVQETHQVDNDLRVTVAFLFGWQFADVLNHVLHIAAVL